MRTIPLRSKFGCQRCRDRRKKCDEVKPLCGECARLGFTCRWVNLPASKRFPQAKESDAAVTTGSDAAETTTPVIVVRPKSTSSATQALVVRRWSQDASPAFDDPSVLRTDAVPDNGTYACKHILQYLSEKGASMLRFPSERSLQGGELNSFRAGYQMAAHVPPHLVAYLCLGAGHLSRIDATYEKIALKHYTTALFLLRRALLGSDGPPAEWVCAVAALLAFYELVVFNSAESRIAHLIGFHRLVEARLKFGSPWSPLKILQEQYIHSLTIGCLFQPALLDGQRSPSYVDGLMKALNDGSRPLGREVVGVPEELTTVAYKLSVLNVCDTTRAPWDAELFAAACKLRNWKPAPHTLTPTAHGLLLVARLYQLACSCLLQVIIDRTADASNEVISACLCQAHDILRSSPAQFRPFNSLSWPLTILSIFAVDASQRSAFKQPIMFLVENGKIQGYSTIISFLSLIEAEGIGPAVFQRPDLLSLVHM